MERIFGFSLTRFTCFTYNNYQQSVRLHTKYPSDVNLELYIVYKQPRNVLSYFKLCDMCYTILAILLKLNSALVEIFARYYITCGVSTSSTQRYRQDIIMSTRL